MRPFYALLAVCAGTAQVAWSQTTAPVTPPPQVTAPVAPTLADGATTPGATAPIMVAKAPVSPAQNAPDGAPGDGALIVGVPVGGTAVDGTPKADGGKTRDGQREQDREERRLQYEARLREMLAGYGITNSDTQDAIIAYLAQEEVGRGPLRDATRKLLFGLRRDAPPERMRELLDNYKKAVATDKERRIRAQNALNAKIGYSLDPRLESLLWVSGMLGDGQTSSVPLSMGRGGNQNGGRDGGRGPAQDGGGPPGGPPGLGRPGFVPQGYTGPQRGSVTGIVEKKDTSWLEIRDDKGDVQRYFAIYKAELKAFDPRGLTLIAQTNVGQRVQLDWFWLEKRRITRLTADTTPVPATPAVPTTPVVPGTPAVPGTIPTPIDHTTPAPATAPR